MATHLFFFSPYKLSLSHTRFLTAFHHQHPSRNQNLAICCSSIKKPRASRKVMSDEELRNELKEFISVMIFPEDHVPSMKDLSLHGRNDLAYIVRRRGYKRISELLASLREIGSDVDIAGDLLEKLDAALDCETEAKDSCQDVKVDNLDEHESLMNEKVESLTQDPVMKADERSSTNVESLAEFSLKEKVEKFIETGELDAFEDDAFGILNESGAEVLNDGSSDLFEPPAKENYPPRAKASDFHMRRNDFSSTETPNSADSDNDMEVEAGERENQTEISNLKIMLQQKELELSRLKEQVEKEKIALSELQFKAESEISKVLKLVSEKDEELHAAEESLSGLKEVVVQYEGDGEIVEVAGSFNGWYRRIPLDPQPPSSTGSRKSRLWSTILWLYPGEYEIKFVVDGQWMIDPRRESVTRGSLHNNILRVDR